MLQRVISFVESELPDEYTNENSISFSLTLSEVSDLQIYGTCGEQSFASHLSGSVTLGALSEGAYSDCKINATDSAGGVQGLLECATQNYLTGYLMTLAEFERQSSKAVSDCIK